jgi:tetratricopeptide (TPR) repeat protein
VDPVAEQLVSRLRNDPNDIPAYEALKRHYAESGDVGSLVNLIEGWAEYQPNTSLAGQAFVEAARHWQSAGGDAERSVSLYRRALEKDPEQRDATMELVGVLQATGDVQELARFLDEQTRVLDDRAAQPALLSELYSLLGDLWRDAFERPDVARPCYERALELNPQNTSAAYGARKLTQASGDVDATVHSYAREAEAETDPERKAQLYAKLAELHASTRDDLDGAVHALRTALAAVPGDVQVMHQLAHYLTARAARQQGSDADRDRRRAAELYYQIAQGVDPEEGLAYLQAALSASPSHDGALAMLEHLAPRLAQTDLLPGYWVAYLAHATEGPEVDQRRMSLAQAYERAGQVDDAIFCLEQGRSDGQIASYLAELIERRGGRASSPGHAPAMRSSSAGSVRPGAGTPTDIEAALLADSMPAPADDMERPTAQPPARSRSASPTPAPASRLAQLHASVHELLAARKNDDAAELCREILGLDPGDPEAFSLLESHYRKQRDHARLRDLLIASTRIGGLSIDARKLRLREVAGLCEAKLKDADGAIEALQGVVALDPTDSDAVKNLKRLLQKAQRWDDFTAVLEREALAATRTEEKVELLGQIAAIHRDKRNDLTEAAEALRQLLALRPDPATRNELCDMLLSLEHHLDAVPLLRERANEALDERERVTLLRTLASTLDDKLSDGDAAFDVYQELLALRPKDTDALERMQRIDEKSGNVVRLISTLERRALVATRAERPALFLQMGELSEHKQGDVDKAAEYYGNVLDLDPGHEAALSALYEMFERHSRHADLVDLLRERVRVEQVPERRVELYRRMARMLHEHLGDDDEAAEAYEGLLGAKEDEEALRFLVTYRREQDRSPALRSDLLQRLASLVGEASDKRDLLFEQSDLLIGQLERPREALECLRKIVEEIDPEFEPAQDRYAALCEQLGDIQGLSSVLQRKLASAESTAERVALQQRLADVYEGRLSDSARAIDALLGWAKDAPSDVEPRRRARKLLDGQGRHADLLETLDALATLEDEFDARDAAVLDAARLAFDGLRDVDGAFQRLAPLVQEGHDDASALLLDIARKAGRGAQLAGLHVAAAQDAQDTEAQGRHWSAAARIFADDLGDANQALEAALRMLATDLANRDYLTQVDDYAARVGAWPRLNQVYDKLLKLAIDDTARVELLVRHAALLDERGDDASEALDRVLRACGLAPNDDALLSRAEVLAKRAGRSEELLVVYDRKRSKATDDSSKVDVLLRSARLSDGALQDRDRANVYLKSALGVAKSNPDLVAVVVRTAEELDKKRPDQGPDQALRALVRAHREIADKADAETGATLILQAHTLLCERLKDERAGFDMLRQGVSSFPLRDDLYATLLERAIQWKRLDAVDAHLSRAIDEAMEPKTAAVLLERRASLLEGPLGRAEDAADVFARLVQLRPDDAGAAEKLRRSLRLARRYQDLLLAVHKQMQRARSPEEKLALLKDAAQTWEQDLKNRWEALDAWRKVLEFAPEDAEARSAVTRLDRRSMAPPARTTEDLFADEPQTDPRAALRDAPLPSEMLAAPEASAPEPQAALDDVTTQQPAMGTEPPPPSASFPTESEPPTVRPPAVSEDVAATTPVETQSEPTEATAPEPETAPVHVDVELPSDDEEEEESGSDLAMLDAVLAATPATTSQASSSEPPDAPTDTLTLPAPSSVPPPRLTKPPTLPPRRSRSLAPVVPTSQAPRGASMPPPIPPSPGRVSVLPPSARTSGVPPIPERRGQSAAPPPPPPRSSKSPSLPPPLPPRSQPGTLSAAPAAASEPPTPPSSPGHVVAAPPPLPKRKKR